MIEFLFWAGVFIFLILFNPRDIIDLFLEDAPVVEQKFPESSCIISEA